jgi:hypothetical protein
LTTPTAAPSTATWKDWSLRPLVLFVATYTIVAILHELAHAVTAYALNVPAVLYHLYVHIDRADGTLSQRAMIGVAGPLFCLLLGLVCWFAYWRSVGTRARLLLLYLAWFGVATLLGNMISTPFVGDFSALAQAMQWRMSLRYALSITGAVLLCGWAFFVGRELRQWAPARVSAVKALTGVIIIPVVVGTLVALLIFLPMSSTFAFGRLAESSFWIFAAVGTLFSRKQFAGALRSGLSWGDVALLLFAVLVVRLTVNGIAFVP